MPSPIKASGTAEAIVLAAAKLFASQGYHGTSTREIARIAGVSENTLFRHFDNKEGLFWSALLWYTKGIRFRRDLQEGLGRCDPPEVILPKLFELLSDTATYRPELIRLIAVAYLELHSKMEVYCQEHFSHMVSAINQYLTANMKKGVIHELDPAMLTASFMMLAVMHPGLSKLLGKDTPSNAGDKQPARAYARFWLGVLISRPQLDSQEAAAFGKNPGPLANGIESNRLDAKMGTGLNEHDGSQH
jgi:AcrR family transcriptional regulator